MSIEDININIESHDDDEHFEAVEDMESYEDESDDLCVDKLFVFW